MSEETGSTGTTGSIQLRLQRLSGPMQILSVGALASIRAADECFSTKNIVDLLKDLHLPENSNVSKTLSRLKHDGLLMRPKDDAWALTPEGEDRLSRDGIVFPSAQERLEFEQTQGSEFGSQHQGLIPPFLGPMNDGLKKILNQTRFEENVMLITRFPKVDGDIDIFNQLVSKMRTLLASFGLTLHVASDGMLEDLLWPNVVTYMWACKYAIVVIDSPDGMLNSNVLIEIGGMLMTGRRCAILRDNSVPDMPSDLVGHIYKPVDLSNHEECLDVLDKWVRNDLGISEGS